MKARFLEIDLTGPPDDIIDVKNIKFSEEIDVNNNSINSIS